MDMTGNKKEMSGLTKEEIYSLIEKALEMRSFSYTPYSHFRVGAALLAKDGKVYGGCNVENAAYTPTNCAERTAFLKAISEGQQEFRAMAIVGGIDEPQDYCAPCGVCRQVMVEFCNPEEFIIIMAKSAEEYRSMSLAELLPEGFGAGSLK